MTGDRTDHRTRGRTRWCGLAAVWLAFVPVGVGISLFIGVIGPLLFAVLLVGSVWQIATGTARGGPWLAVILALASLLLLGVCVAVGWGILLRCLRGAKAATRACLNGPTAEELRAAGEEFHAWLDHVEAWEHRTMRLPTDRARAAVLGAIGRGEIRTVDAAEGWRAPPGAPAGVAELLRRHGVVEAGGGIAGRCRIAREDVGAWPRDPGVMRIGTGWNARPLLARLGREEVLVPGIRTRGVAGEAAGFPTVWHVLCLHAGLGMPRQEES